MVSLQELFSKCYPCLVPDITSFFREGMGPFTWDWAKYYINKEYITCIRKGSLLQNNPLMPVYLSCLNACEDKMTALPSKGIMTALQHPSCRVVTAT